MDFLDKVIDDIEEKKWIIMDYNGILFFKKIDFNDHIIDYVV